MILATLLTSYLIAPGTTNTYWVEVGFEGWIPMFGGREGKASAKFVVTATGMAPSKAGNHVVEAEITEIEARAFDSVLPLNKNNVSQFFPKAQVEFKSNGEVMLNTAPAVKMPVRLPGLDSRRLPEISYLPLQLPSVEPKDGSVYEFTREFDGVPLRYVVTTEKVNLEIITFKIALEQKTSGFEDAYGNPSDEKNAKRKLAGVLSGSGIAQFNRALSRFDYVIVKNETTTTFIPIGKGKEGVRTLKTTLKITRDGVKMDL
jgi:hypothetical protein